MFKLFTVIHKLYLGKRNSHGLQGMANPVSVRDSFYALSEDEALACTLTEVLDARW